MPREGVERAGRGNGGRGGSKTGKTNLVEGLEIALKYGPILSTFSTDPCYLGSGNRYQIRQILYFYDL